MSRLIAKALRAKKAGRFIVLERILFTDVAKEIYAKAPHKVQKTIIIITIEIFVTQARSVFREQDR